MTVLDMQWLYHHMQINADLFNWAEIFCALSLSLSDSWKCIVYMKKHFPSSLLLKSLDEHVLVVRMEEFFNKYKEKLNSKSVINNKCRIWMESAIVV